MSRNHAPGRLTFCVLVFGAVYPLVTGLAYLMQATAHDWDIWQRHLIVVPVIVLAMVFVIIPVIQRTLVRWSDRARSLDRGIRSRKP
jgi:antibiotic biosynthesis monooxygenase (ABM) superfamily enzyme